MRTNDGYTLIEILVSLSLIAIIFGAGYIAYRDFTQRQLIVSARRAFVADLKLAQTEALAGAKPDVAGCRKPYILDGYEFLIIEPDKYQITANCSADRLESRKIVIKNVVLAQGVAIAAPSTNPIFFKSLGHGNNIPVGTNATITLSALGFTGSVTVTSGGRIE